MKDLKKGLEKSMKQPGKLEYVFGVVGVILILPLAIVYFALMNAIIKPFSWLKRKIWK